MTRILQLIFCAVTLFTSTSCSQFATVRVFNTTGRPLNFVSGDLYSESPLVTENIPPNGTHDVALHKWEAHGIWPLFSITRSSSLLCRLYDSSQSVSVTKQLRKQTDEWARKSWFDRLLSSDLGVIEVHRLRGATVFRGASGECVQLIGESRE
jgi:hypothetical protein